MKKSVKPDIADLVNKMQEQLVNLEKKIDTLINKSSPGPVEAKPFPKPFQQTGRTHSQGGGRQDNSYRERVLHKAICADCKKECEVPFKPSGERPVYCKECFSKRRAVGPFKRRPDNRPVEAPPMQVIHVNKPQAAEKKKPIGKKRPAVKRRKTR